MAVDLGWVPYSAQVGLSGKSVTPRIYIHFGISGAVQHIAGISGAETIIAVNHDPEAPIFRVADLSIQGDAMEILDALIDSLEERAEREMDTYGRLTEGNHRRTLIRFGSGRHNNG